MQALTGQAVPACPCQICLWQLLGGEHWLREYRQLDATVAAKEGVPFTIRDVQDAARNQCQGHVEPVEGLTTDSFTRVLPTLGHMLLQFSDEEHLALGDWLDKDQSKAAMPQHYSAAKYQQSVKLKHKAYEVAAKISTYESWEMVPYTTSYKKLTPRGLHQGEQADAGGADDSIGHCPRMPCSCKPSSGCPRS